MTAYFPPLLQTDRAEGYARPRTVKPEILPQHQRALHEIQTDPAFIAHLQWMQSTYREFAWIDPHNPSTYSLKFLQEADGTVRINVKANPTDIGKHLPVHETRFQYIHELASYLLGIGGYPVPAPAPSTPLPSPRFSPRFSPRVVSPRGTPSPVPSTDDEDERPRRLSPEFEALQQMVREQQQQIARQGDLVANLTQFIQTQAGEQRQAQATQLDALQRANEAAINDLKAAHTAAMEEFRRMHDDSREDLLAAMGDMQRQHQQQLEILEKQRGDLAEQNERLHADHQEALQTLRQDRDAQIQQIDRRHSATLRAFREDRNAQMQQMTDHHAAEMQAARDLQAASEERFTQALADHSDRSDQRLADAQRHSEQLVQQVTQDAGRWRTTLLRQSREHRQEMVQQFTAYREDLNARFEELHDLIEALQPPAPSIDDLASPQASRPATPRVDGPDDDESDSKGAGLPEDEREEDPPVSARRDLVQEYGAENFRLFGENTELRDQAAQADLRYRVLAARVPDLERQILQLEEIRTRYNEAQRHLGQLAPMEQELRTLRTLIGRKDSDIRQMSDALRDLELRASEALRNAQHYRTQVERLERQIAQLREQAPDQSALEHLQTQLEQQQQLRQRAEEQAERLQGINRNLQQTISQQDERIMESDHRRDEAIEDLAAAEAEFATQREQLEAQMAGIRLDWLAQMRDLQAAHAEALERVGALEADMDGHIAAREAAESDLQTTEQQNSLLQRQLRQSRSLLALQEGHLERLEARVAELTFLLIARQPWMQRLNQPFVPHSFRHVSERPRPQIEMIVPPPQEEAVQELEAAPQERSLILDSSEPFDDYSRLFFAHIPRSLSGEPRMPRPPFAPQMIPSFRSPFALQTNPFFRSRFSHPYYTFPIWDLINPQLPIPRREARPITDVVLTGDVIDDQVALYQFLDQERRESATAELEDGTQLQPLIRNPLFNFQRQQPAFPVSFSGSGPFGIFSHLLRQPSPSPAPQNTTPRMPALSGNPLRMPNNSFPFRRTRPQDTVPQQREQPFFSEPVIDDYSRLLHQHLMNRRQASESARAPVQQTPQTQQQQTPPPRSFSSEDFMFWSN